MDLETTIEKLSEVGRKVRKDEDHYVADTIAEAIVYLKQYNSALDKVEYTIGRDASMPDMSGRRNFTIVTSTVFHSYEAAESALRNVPSLRDREAVILKRVGPVTVWEVAENED